MPNETSNVGDLVVVRPAAIEELVDLRHAVLRQGLPREAAVFPGDESPMARHYGAFRGAEVLCCATLHASEWEGERAWQLRGMATAPAARRQGLGRRLLARMEQDLLSDARASASSRPDEITPVLLWCNARVPAVDFYREMGWRVVSDVFEIPTAGPHVRMVKRLEETTKN